MLRILITLAAMFGVAAARGETPSSVARLPFANSVKAIEPGPSAGPHVVRTALTQSELDAPMNIVVSLQVRSFDELNARVQKGESVSQAELESKYLPLQSAYDNMASWLGSQGFSVTLRDRLHTNVIVRGKVSAAARAFGASFARVATADGEFTSAITAPSLPKEIAGGVVGIEGLQPHILMHPPSRNDSAASNVPAVIPQDVLTAYNLPVGVDGNNQAFTGIGQSIAIVMDASPSMSDMNLFWSKVGTTFPAANFTIVNVDGGATATTDQGEANLDSEWVTALASGSRVLFYAMPKLTSAEFLTALTQIETDGIAGIVTYSAAGPETDFSQSTFQSTSQQTALMAAGGITILAASGDGGSNPVLSTVGHGYDPNRPLSACYPASDPSVTGVGGTNATFDASWNLISETTWNDPGTGGSTGVATAGGISQQFSRPSWQHATGMPAGSMRCVPDVSAMASTTTQAPGSTSGGAYTINGGLPYVSFGTSLSSPIWAAVAAFINQERKSVGLNNSGLLNPVFYAPNDGNSFNDITTGSNGAYSAGTGYDLCTGMGTPNIFNLIINDVSQISGVSVPSSPVATGAQVTISATSQFSASTYQWYLNGNPISGATAPDYTISSATTADNGDYTVTITNSQLGAQTYDLGNLTVTPPSGDSGPTARLINISTRAQVGTGANILIPGFYIAGTGTETLLIRADGPGLTQFKVAGVLAQPILSVYDSNQKLIATNTGWGTNSNASDIATVAAKVGAFALQAGSADCALIVSLPAGGYTVQVAGVGGTTGVALAEVYEVSTTGTWLSNISTRAQVGTDSNILIPGFYISGTGTEKLLVRADGPALAQFKVAGVLAQPNLGIYNSAQTIVAGNTGWTTSANPAEITSVSSKVGAFALPAASADSADVVSLSPGGYTIQISGVGNTTGVALAEVYEDQ